MNLKERHWDHRYIKNVESLSKPEYEVIEERNIFIPLRDGVQLCLDVFRPKTEKKVPALVAASAYGKDPQSIGVPQQPPESVTFDHMVEAGNIHFFVSRGYSFVIPDLRGVGKSEGEWHGLYSEQDQLDCHDVIEWAANQSWCNGNVGMMGHSYFGIMQMLTAGQKPKHLKAIAPIETFIDFYRRAYPGGTTSTWYWFLLHYCMAHTPILESERIYSKDELNKRISQRLNEKDIHSNSFLVREFNALKKHPSFSDLLLHPNHGSFWERRSAFPKLKNIEVPIYMGGFWGYYGYIDGTFDAFESDELNVPKKVGILSYGTADAKLPLQLYDEELLRWYDYWLKNIDTGIMDEPPIKILITGKNQLRFEKEWPLKRTKWKKYYLKRYEELSIYAEEDSKIDPDPLVHLPPSISTKQNELHYRTKPFNKSTEFTGPIALKLYVSLDKEDINFVVKLFDVSPNGEKLALTKGYLKASQRKLDENKSKPWRPHHTYSNPEPMTPNKIYELNIALSPIAHVFLKDHRMELEISTYDSFILPEESLGLGASVEDKMTAMGIVPNADLTIAKIYRDTKYQSSLIMPWIEETDDDLWVQPVSK